MCSERSEPVSATSSRSLATAGFTGDLSREALSREIVSHCSKKCLGHPRYGTLAADTPLSVVEDLPDVLKIGAPNFDVIVRAFL